MSFVSVKTTVTNVNEPLPPFLWILTLTLSINLCIFCLVQPVTYMTMSSAYLRFPYRRKMYTLNNKGLKIEPCGTLVVPKTKGAVCV